MIFQSSFHWVSKTTELDMNTVAESFQSSFHWARWSSWSHCPRSLSAFNPLFIERPLFSNLSYPSLFAFNPLFIELNAQIRELRRLFGDIFQSSFHWEAHRILRKGVVAENDFQSSFHWENLGNQSCLFFCLIFQSSFHWVKDNKDVLELDWGLSFNPLFIELKGNAQA